jgi:uracil-DNA glycosylase
MREDEPPFCGERWLNISGDFSPRNFFWIHLANCSVDRGGRYDECSKMWLEKTINLMMAAGRAELVLAFGGRAARYLLRNREEIRLKKVLDLVNGRDLFLERGGGSLKCLVLFHWSPRNAWRNKEGQYGRAHERSLEYAKEAIRKVISSEPKHPEVKV